MFFRKEFFLLAPPSPAYLAQAPGLDLVAGKNLRRRAFHFPAVLAAGVAHPRERPGEEAGMPEGQEVVRPTGERGHP